MRVIIFGDTGMVAQGAPEACLRDEKVSCQASVSE